jgi:hypothetical protein
MVGCAQKYLVEDPKREREAIRKLLDLKWFAHEIFGLLGLDVGFSWFLLDVKKDKLCTFAKGDIDILAGRLEWEAPKEFEDLLNYEFKGKENWHPSNVVLLAAVKYAATGGIKWPPSTDWLVAVEAKCAYLSPQADRIALEHFKSTKTSAQAIRHTRAQVKDLVRLGFDRVALLDIIANPPVSGPDGQAWLAAADLADRSMRTVSQILERRLSQDSVAGHYLWSIGAVAGGDEGRRGAGSPVELKRARDNPFLSDSGARERREEGQQNLRTQFATLPKPLHLRTIFSDCGLCGRVHLEGAACT